MTSPATSLRVPCDLCGSRARAALSRKDRRGRPLRTVVCRECGLVRHWHVPTERQLSEFYARQYRQDYHGEETPSDRRVMRAWKNGERIYRLLAPHLAAGARVMEVGAGIGCTVKTFEQQGVAATGIEPHVGFQTYAQTQLRAQVTNESLFTHRTSRPYDVILLVHVIEHFRSPRLALQAIHQLLAPGGLLYLECPNLAAPFAAPGKLFHFAHIHNFTPTTLEGLATRCGYSTVTWLSPPRDPQLTLLVRKEESPRQPAETVHGYAETREALARYNVWTYHARASYLRDRWHKVRGYLAERLWARSFVQQKLAQCAAADRVVERRAA